ncbi:hypothetical protein I6E26_07315 [Anaerovibrio lipolyticus]|nr:hypothetical protein [Anaerovibrio lipolyticus]
MASTGVTDATKAQEAMKKADAKVYGDDVADAIAKGTMDYPPQFSKKAADSGNFVAKDGTTKIAIDNTAKAALGSVEGGTGKAGEKVAKAIATYNEGAKAGEEIDISKLKAYMTIDKTAGAVTADNDADKMEMLKILAQDPNAAKLAAKQADAKAAIDAYNTYSKDRVASSNEHTAVVSSATVGIDAAGDKVDTASGEAGISITAHKGGIGGQISGLNISITDSKGNVKKSANAALDAFSETVRAQNKSDDNAITLQVGASANQSIKVGLTDMRAEALGLKGADGTTLNISTQGKANAAINVLDNAIQKALDQQTTIGSVESRLEYTSSNLTTASENVQASESTIRDADMAKEMTNYTKNNVLLQAAQSMLAQANQSSSNVLSLLQ